MMMVLFRKGAWVATESWGVIVKGFDLSLTKFS